VHVGDELREVNGIAVLHKRPEEISQILVRAACLLGGGGSGSASLFPEEAAGKVVLQCALDVG
jgi:hypothetical protein